ncbi:MAG: tetratricopeptide repeat protein, partial [Blastocatellia bacterium]|nr:tetratricopeptide repeat protein [Blastocatellia bacterium]
MSLESLKLLIQLYIKPLSTMTKILDEINWVPGLLMTLTVSLLFYYGVSEKIYKGYEAVFPVIENFNNDSEEVSDSADEVIYEEKLLTSKPLPLFGQYGWLLFSFSRSRTVSTFLTLSLLHVPLVLMFLNLFEPQASLSNTINRDYGSLLTCSFMAWTAAHLPFAFLGFFLPQTSASLSLMLWVVAKSIFAGFMLAVLRSLFGARLSRSLLIIVFSSLSIALENFALGLPFTIFWLYLYVKGEEKDVGAIYRNRRAIRRNLQAAAINPQDAEANYQLGLAYQHRRQYNEAIIWFQKAVEIDFREIDAHFQLGKIAKLQARLQDAITHFNNVVVQDEKHSQNEIWREIGSTYLAASMFEDAFNAIEKYVERREYDPEGLYYMGVTLVRLNRQEEAKRFLEKAIEA